MPTKIEGCSLTKICSEQQLGKACYLKTFPLLFNTIFVQRIKHSSKNEADMATAKKPGKPFGALYPL